MRFGDNRLLLTALDHYSEMQAGEYEVSFLNGIEDVAYVMAVMADGYRGYNKLKNTGDAVSISGDI